MTIFMPGNDAMQVPKTNACALAIASLIASAAIAVPFESPAVAGTLDGHGQVRSERQELRILGSSPVRAAMARLRQALQHDRLGASEAVVRRSTAQSQPTR